MNEILFDHEKLGGNLRRADIMSDFRHYLEDYGLTDLDFVGHRFMWTNKQVGINNI